MSFPEKINSILNSFLYQKGYSPTLNNLDLVLNWNEIVGDEIGLASKCLGVSNKILFITVKSSSWRQEISFLKKEIIRKILKKNNSISDIVFL